MRVSRKAFKSLVENSFLRVAYRRDFQRAKREQLVGLGLRLALENQDRLTPGWLQQELEDQSRKCGIAIGEIILTVIVTKIVELIIQWILDSQKKVELMTAGLHDWYELPELK